MNQSLALCVIAISLLFAVVIPVESDYYSKDDEHHQDQEEHNSSSTGEEREDTAETSSNAKALQVYQRLFLEKRAQHVRAMEEMLASYEYQKQYQMVELIADRISQMFTEARKQISASGFEPGMPLPTDEITRNMVSVLLENAAFMGDIVLRLPDIAHKVLDKKKQFKDELKWCMDFSERTDFLDGVHKQLLNLMSQELDFIPKEPTYHNPYKKNIQIKEEENEPTKKEKKPKKKKKKGPRMSKVEL